MHLQGFLGQTCTVGLLWSAGMQRESELARVSEVNGALDEGFQTSGVITTCQMEVLVETVSIGYLARSIHLTPRGIRT